MIFFGQGDRDRMVHEELSDFSSVSHPCQDQFGLTTSPDNDCVCFLNELRIVRLFQEA